MIRGGQPVASVKTMEALTSGLGRIGSSHFLKLPESLIFDSFDAHTHANRLTGMFSSDKGLTGC